MRLLKPEPTITYDDDKKIYFIHFKISETLLLLMGEFFERSVLTSFITEEVQILLIINVEKRSKILYIYGFSPFNLLQVLMGFDSWLVT